MYIKSYRNSYSYVFLLFYASVAAYLIGCANFKNAFWSWHDLQRISQGLFVLTTGTVFVLLSNFKLNRADAITVIPWFIKMGFTAVLVLGFFSCLSAAYPRWAFLEWSSFLLLIISSTFIATIRVYAGKEFDRKLIFICVAACTVYLIGCLARYSTIFGGISLNVWTLFDGFVNIRFFGHFQTMTLPLLVLPIFLVKSRAVRYAAFLLLACWWMLAVASGTRGTWLGMAVAVAAIWFIGRPVCRTWVRWQILGLAVGFSLYLTLFFVVPFVFQSDVQTVDRLPNLFGLSAREILWKAALEIIANNPFLGAGPMHFGIDPLKIGANPHNAILQLASEWGIPAMLIILSMAMYGIYRLAVKIKYKNENEASFLAILQVALFACLIGAATQSMVDGIIVMPYSQTILVVMIGWAMGIHASEAVVRPSQSTAKIEKGLVILLALGLGAITFYAATPSFSQLDEKEQTYISTYGGLFTPRFWLQGLIHPNYWAD